MSDQPVVIDTEIKLSVPPAEKPSRGVGVTRKSHEESKKRKKMAKNSRRRNRRK